MWQCRFYCFACRSHSMYNFCFRTFQKKCRTWGYEKSKGEEILLWQDKASHNSRLKKWGGLHQVLSEKTIQTNSQMARFPQDLIQSLEGLLRRTWNLRTFASNRCLSKLSEGHFALLPDRLNSCLQHENWTIEHWKNVLFSDENRIAPRSDGEWILI